MKKSMKLITITLIALLTLTACGSSAKTSVTDGDQVIAEVKGTTITKDDIYEYSKLKFGTAIITKELINWELEKYVELTDAEMKEAQDTLAEAKENLKDNFEMLIQSQGFKDEDDYFNNYIVINLKNEKLFKMYAEEQIEAIMETNNTRKIKVLQTETKAEAEAALEELLALEELTAESFTTVATQYAKDESELVAESKIEHVYTGREKDTYLNTQLKDTKPGLIKEAVMTEDGFVIIYVEDIDLEVDKDAILSSFEANKTISEVIMGDAYVHYAELGNFQIHDEQLNEMFKQKDPLRSK